MGEITMIDPPERHQRYAVYSLRNSTDDGLIYTRSFIVLKNDYGVIVRFTRLQEYAGVYENKTYRPLSSNPEGKLYYIVNMLNYIIVDHGSKYGVKHLFGITKDMLRDYFNAYGSEPLPGGGHRSAERVEGCIYCVTAFMYKISKAFAGYTKLRKNELYVERQIRTDKGTLVKKNVPDFQAVVVDDGDEIFRDLHTKALEILIPMAFRYAPDIAFAMCLQAFAGLRASEAMNVRQECSPLGAGLTFTEIGGHVRDVRIDLRRELMLRSDGAEIGQIKKERIQKVYPAFIGTFCAAYKLHKRYLRGVSYEKEFAPMFVNSNGMAMSYESYRQKFRDLIDNYLRVELVKSSDPELRIYGQLLYENKLGTHSLRHWFSVQLVLRGEDIGSLQYWRGDRNPESAFTYLQNKGELIRELKYANEALADTLLQIGGELYGDL